MKIFALGILLILFHPLPAAAEAEGGEVGNGGQEIALEFATYGADLASLIEQYFHPGAPACSEKIFSDLCTIDILNLRNVVRAARVTSMPELVRTDEKSGEKIRYVALNFPHEQRILVSEAEWQKPSFCFVKKMPIVLHEYLGLLGIEIQNYRYSSLFSHWLKKTAPIEKFAGCPELKN